MWRAGLRIQEALALTEGDLDHRRGSLLVRRGKGGRRREVGMDAWGWEQLQPWLDMQRELPVDPPRGVGVSKLGGRDGARRRAAYRDPAPVGHSNLGITSVYLQGIDSGEIIETVHARRAPMVPVSVSLRL
jgi:integrase